MADQPLGGILPALKHVTRRQLLRCLIESEGPRTAEDLADQVPKSLSAVSYHLRVLSGAGLAKPAGRKRKRGPVELLYGATVEDNAPVLKLLAETAESDERLLPRSPA
jgi:DNA-binding transcriptional ArsR family regulator